MSSYYVRTFVIATPDTKTVQAVCTERFVAEHLLAVARETGPDGKLIVDGEVVSERELVRTGGKDALVRAAIEASQSDLWVRAVKVSSMQQLLKVQQAHESAESSKARLRAAIQDALAAKFTLQQISAFAGMSHEQVRRLSQPDGPKALSRTIEQARESAHEYLRDTDAFALGFPAIDAALPGGGARRAQLGLLRGFPSVSSIMLPYRIAGDFARRGVSCVFVTGTTEAGVRCMVGAHLFRIAPSHVRNLDPDQQAQLDALMKLIIVVEPDRCDPTRLVSRFDLSALEDQLTSDEMQPISVTIIDSSAQFAPGPSAPRSVADDPMQLHGYVMQTLARITKISRSFMLVSRLDETLPSGVQLEYDAGRGSSKLTDYCDYVFVCWQPTPQEAIVRMAKNRHGEVAEQLLTIDEITHVVDVWRPKREQ